MIRQAQPLQRGISRESALIEIVLGAAGTRAGLGAAAQPAPMEVAEESEASFWRQDQTVILIFWICGAWLRWLWLRQPQAFVQTNLKTYPSGAKAAVTLRLADTRGVARKSDKGQLRFGLIIACTASKRLLWTALLP